MGPCPAHTSWRSAATRCTASARCRSSRSSWSPVSASWATPTPGPSSSTARGCVAIRTSSTCDRCTSSMPSSSQRHGRWVTSCPPVTSARTSSPPGSSSSPSPREPCCTSATPSCGSPGCATPVPRSTSSSPACSRSCSPRRTGLPATSLPRPPPPPMPAVSGSSARPGSWPWSSRAARFVPARRSRFVSLTGRPAARARVNPGSALRMSGLLVAQAGSLSACPKASAYSGARSR